MIRLANRIRSIPDFPKKGILFRDITTLLNDPKAFKASIDEFAKTIKSKKIDAIVAAESRGFIFGAALAYKLGCAFIPVRKPGKLPYKTYRATYALEYGTDSLEIHRDAFKKGARILIIDDLLATGGTAQAMANLVKKMGGRLAGIIFLIELTFLNGRKKLKNLPVSSIIQY
jgi:adenine phosphoribosyltransferase